MLPRRRSDLRNSPIRPSPRFRLPPYGVFPFSLRGGCVARRVTVARIVAVASARRSARRCASRICVWNLGILQGRTPFRMRLARLCLCMLMRSIARRPFNAACGVAQQHFTNACYGAPPLRLDDIRDYSFLRAARGLICLLVCNNFTFSRYTGGYCRLPPPTKAAPPNHRA